MLQLHPGGTGEKTAKPSEGEMALVLGIHRPPIERGDEAAPAPSEGSRIPKLGRPRRRRKLPTEYTDSTGTDFR